jgi:hypothetical protein
LLYSVAIHQTKATDFRNSFYLKDRLMQQLLQIGFATDLPSKVAADQADADEPRTDMVDNTWARRCSKGSVTSPSGGKAAREAGSLGR